MRRDRNLLAGLLAIGFFCGTMPLLGTEGKLDSLQRGRVREMLKNIEEDVRKHYYDQKFHGVDIEAKFREADRVIQNADDLSAAFSAIAAALEPLNDSHTFFLPPSRTVRLEYGFRMQMMGDSCFVTQVRPGTDAASKLKIGDQVIGIEGYRIERNIFYKMIYFFNVLSPRDALHLVIRATDGSQRMTEVHAKIREEKRVTDLTGEEIWNFIRDIENAERLLRDRYYELPQAFIWKMPEFDQDEGEIDHMFDRIHKYPNLILDLRGNPGGAVKALEGVIGSVFDHDVKIADRVTRRDKKPLIAKTRGKGAYAGKIFVLVDDDSASASELFARMMQIEHRGTVLGDLSSGSVMEAQRFSYKLGVDTVMFYGASITDADLIMADGKSLEHVGVQPDQLILPSAQDLAAGNDPVMSRAAELAGFRMDAATAGKLFPFEWRPL
jgi:C-terminal processing protease CtpA/Prc